MLQGVLGLKNNSRYILFNVDNVDVDTLISKIINIFFFLKKTILFSTINNQGWSFDISLRFE